MQNNVLQYLEDAKIKFPNNIAYQSESETITFSQVYDEARQIGSLLCKYTERGRPVIVLSDKTVHVPSIYMGVVYAGCFYIPLSTELPSFRIRIIMDIVKADIVLTAMQDNAIIDSLGFDGRIVSVDEAKEHEIDEYELAQRVSKTLDVDPLYVLFTSGSSGRPKGVITPHKAVIDYIDIFAKTFNIRGDDIFGNQAPLDYVAAIRDIFLPMYSGAKTVLIPKSLFSMPQKLFDYVNEYKITTLCWVASALALCSELQVFKVAQLETVNKVIFTGSVLAVKHLKVWMNNLPHAMFVNHYGPTEITASCTYYLVDKQCLDSEAIPIGIPFGNTDILLLDENGRRIEAGAMGEICVRGTCVALGYYHDLEKTKEVFIQNPLQTDYPEIIYKTGDLGVFEADGNLSFHGRKDFQIKHMGHRIELGEVEATASSMETIQNACCLYSQEQEQLWLFYSGQSDNKELAKYLRTRIPSYMVPRKLVKLDTMPKSFNGKIDMEALRKIMGGSDRDGSKL